MFENSYTDIFTEYDDAIFSDGSIDPMGLRIIWTSLGNKIFQNKLNTISTDIRYYTLNLFHHYVIRQCESQFDDKMINLISRPPYNNRQDLHDGIIIFLESLLAHAVVAGNIDDEQPENSSVPGTAKLKGLINNRPTDKRVTHLSVDRKEGILVRHNLLGIHGRHKGPFQQMGIFNKSNYYQNLNFWDEASVLFDKSTWKSLANDLISIINAKILSIKNHASTPIKIKVSDVLSRDLISSYWQVLNNNNFKEKQFVSFWEKQLGILEGAAGILYKEFINAADRDDYESIIKSSSNKGSAETNKYLKAICKIEPLLTCIEKVINRLLKRGTSQINSELEDFMKRWLNRRTINLSYINTYMNSAYLSPEALLRLRKLSAIYFDCKDKADPILFVQKIIAFHTELMDGRGNPPWISIGKKSAITLHNSFNYSDDYLKFLETDAWVNSYYLPTVKSLYEGLYNK